mgnify:CR=1 FL=1
MRRKFYHKGLVKKLIPVFLALTFFFTTPINSLAKDVSDLNIVTYEGRDFNKYALSQKTIKWLKWYNSLPAESQQMINYVPSDLQMSISLKSSVPLLYESEPLTYETDSLMISSLLPVGGGEPVYNPAYWNDSTRIKKANCYVYSMDVICTTDRKLQPGELSGKIFNTLTGEDIISAAIADGPFLGDGRVITSTTADEVPADNQYKVALVIAPDQDYHWYVQNSDGNWSHKRGWTEATNVDANGDLITDPQTCNREYEYIDYHIWCGYYMVTRL